MNAAFLLMSSAALVGADVAPPPATVTAPAVISSGAGCSNCGAPAVVSPCDDCGKTKIGLFDKLRGRFSGFGKKSADCGCAPVPAPAPCGSCDSCDPCATAGASRANLFDKLKGRLGHKKHADACGPVCDPCGAHVTSAPPAVGAPPIVTPPAAPPKEMPKPKDKGGVSIPPVTGASGLTGAGNPY